MGGDGACVHVYRPAVKLECHFLRCVLPCSLRLGLSIASSLSNRPDWLDRKPQGAVCLHPHDTPSLPSFSMGSGAPTPVLMLTQESTLLTEIFPKLNNV